jgi:hypothetical protein
MFEKNVRLFFLSNFIVGLFSAVFFVNLHYHPDSDIANSAITWHEVSIHGFRSLSAWRATADNWYFSVYPIHYPLFYFFGATAWIVEIIEILQIFLLAIVSSIIFYKITQNAKSFF